jgi:hypothetical protein
VDIVRAIPKWSKLPYFEDARHSVFRGLLGLGSSDSRVVECAVSIGSPRTEDQRAFKLDLLAVLRTHALSPRTVGRNPEDTDAAYARPFDQICQIIGESHGVVVVAYQKHLAQGFEVDYLSEQNKRSFAAMKLSTAWNQAEAAIAYSLQVPLLMLCEEGVYKEGIFENEGITSPLTLKIGKNSLGDPVFQRTLLSWVTDVRKHAEGARRLDSGHVDLILGKILRGLGILTLHDAVVLYSLAAALLAAAFAVGACVCHVRP